ncbi:MAG: type II toxin-antitoxin system HicB family antitoxin [bacterium]|nr:type II toxin-antitoxin system HicB family antitoxin [bacterium]
MRKINLKNIVWKEGKYFVSQCLNVEISSFGKTKKESLDNLNEALELYFEDIKTPQIAKIQNREIVGLPFLYA